MPAYKDSNQGTWYASFYFENWQGVKQKKLKRGFATKKDALAWEREFLLQQAADLTMTFEAFVEIYITDKKKRLRENTWSTRHLSQQLEQVKAENSQLYAMKRDFRRVWNYFGAEKMQQVIGLMREREQTTDRSQKKNRQNRVEL